MGIEADGIGDDRVFEEAIRLSQEKVKEELFTYHQRETIGNSRAGKSWDGSNTTFNTYNYPIMDSNYDFTVDNNDIDCIWLDSNYNPQTGHVTVSNATLGIVTIKQSDQSTAIPSNADDVMVNYYSCNREISRLHLENLTTLWACHLINGMMKSGTSVSMADFQKNAMLIVQNPDQYRTKYYNYLNQLIGGRTIRGV
jgi:hypothetical protein